jgi:hypothetical protein
VVRSIDSHSPEVLVQPGPTRLALALGELLPGLVGQRLSAWAGVDRLFRTWADARLEPSHPDYGPAPGRETGGSADDPGHSHDRQGSSDRSDDPNAPDRPGSAAS